MRQAYFMAFVYTAIAILLFCTKSAELCAAGIVFVILAIYAWDNVCQLIDNKKSVTNAKYKDNPVEFGKQGNSPYPSNNNTSGDRNY